MATANLKGVRWLHFNAASLSFHTLHKVCNLHRDRAHLSPQFPEHANAPKTLEKLLPKTYITALPLCYLCVEVVQGWRPKERRTYATLDTV
ncbi:MAG: hypothetical protein ACRECJ_09070, partial [Limisphaerales bacterium]